MGSRGSRSSSRGVTCIEDVAIVRWFQPMIHLSPFRKVIEIIHSRSYITLVTGNWCKVTASTANHWWTKKQNSASSLALGVLPLLAGAFTLFADNIIHIIIGPLRLEPIPNKPTPHTWRVWMHNIYACLGRGRSPRSGALASPYSSGPKYSIRCIF
jgi:hypothetical protein